jgi:two-component system cell cycle sensor histidine kinase/response regulator CckA
MASFALTTPARNAALVAATSGIAAAAIVLLLVGSWIAAAGFFAAAVIVIGALIAWRLLNPVAKDTFRPVDWDLTRTVAEAGTDALAITDRAGRLVCANDAYEALFEGFPTPPGLSLDDAGNAALADAGRAAWRDGIAQVDRLNARNLCLSAQIASSLRRNTTSPKRSPRC